MREDEGSGPDDGGAEELLERKVSPPARLAQHSISTPVQGDDRRAVRKATRFARQVSPRSGRDWVRLLEYRYKASLIIG